MTTASRVKKGNIQPTKEHEKEQNDELIIQLDLTMVGKKLTKRNEVTIKSSFKMETIQLISKRKK